VTFLEYCNLPGIIADRFYMMFDPNNEGEISEGQFIK
jgi:hypothetical protein